MDPAVRQAGAHYTCVQCMLAVSLSINVWVLIFATSVKAFSGLVQRGKKKGRRLASLRNVHQKCPVFVGKLFADEVTNLILVVLAIYGLATTDALTHPFLSGDDSGSVVVIFALTIGYHIVQSVLHGLWFGDIPHSLVFLLYHVTSAVWYTISVIYQMNYLLGLIGICMDVDGYFLNIERLFIQCDFSRLGIRYRCLTVTGLVTSIFTRILLTGLGYCLAFSLQSPLLLDPVVLGTTCFGIVFFNVFGLWVVSTWVNSAKTCFGRKNEDDDVGKRCVAMNNQSRPANNGNRSIVMYSNLQSNYHNKLCPDKSSQKAGVNNAVISFSNRSTAEINFYLQRYYGLSQSALERYAPRTNWASVTSTTEGE